MKSTYNVTGADGYSFDEIAAELGLSRCYVQQIYHRALAKLHRECRRRGISAADVLGMPVGMWS